MSNNAHIYQVMNSVIWGGQSEQIGRPTFLGRTIAKSVLISFFWDRHSQFEYHHNGENNDAQESHPTDGL